MYIVPLQPCSIDVITRCVVPFLVVHFMELGADRMTSLPLHNILKLYVPPQHTQLKHIHAVTVHILQNFLFIFTSVQQYILVRTEQISIIN